MKPLNHAMHDYHNPRAARVLQYATGIARELGSACVEPEHLLIALSSDRNALTRPVFESALLSSDAIREELRLFPDVPPAATAAAPQLGSQTKIVLDRAVDEARALGCNYVGVEHLLLGLLTASESKAARVLQAHNITHSTAHAIIAARIAFLKK
jgi:ATP-dependent Clp protease ATP-binding subunit ClpC